MPDDPTLLALAQQRPSTQSGPGQYSEQNGPPLTNTPQQHLQWPDGAPPGTSRAEWDAFLVAGGKPQ